jgi:hypothetical protein
MQAVFGSVLQAGHHAKRHELGKNSTVFTCEPNRIVTSPSVQQTLVQNELQEDSRVRTQGPEEGPHWWPDRGAEAGDHLCWEQRAEVAARDPGSNTSNNSRSSAWLGCFHAST